MHRRRLFQFSIRTLLILMTLTAIGLAFWTRVYQRVRDQKTANARVLDLGGKTKFRQTRRVWPWVQKLVGDDFFQEIISVDLDKTLVTDADLELLGKLRGMRSLSLNGFSLSDPERTLAYNPNLLPSQISSAGIRRLGPQRYLESARLANTPIDDEALHKIALWPLLESLDLKGTRVTSRGIQRLGNLERLKSLNMSRTKIDDGVVPTLCQMRSLQEVDLSYTAVSGAGLLRLREELPACKLRGSFLDFSSGIDPDPDSMRWKEITRAMWSLGRCGQMKLLILAGTPLTDSHLAELDHRLGDVEVIDLRHTKITRAGVEELQRVLPKCRIVRE